MKRTGHAARRRILKHPPTSTGPLPDARPGPEKVRVPLPEKTRSRPFEVALQPLLWRMQREAATAEQPPAPKRWPS